MWRRWRRDFWIVEGRERNSGLPLTLAFSGQLESKCYITHLVFADDCRERRRRVWRWRVERLANGRRARYALAIVERQHRPAHGRPGTFLIPCWVGGDIDVAVAERRIRTTPHLKPDLRRIHKYRLSYAVERAPEQLLRFYDEMYVPYIRNVYGARTFLVSRAEFSAHLPNLEVVMVLRDGEAVAGGTLLYEAGQVRAWCMGVKNGDRRYVREGAIAAIYRYQIAHLASAGRARLHLGASRPFLNDGVLAFKRKWGMRAADRMAKWFQLTCPRHCEAGRAFLAHNPFIYETAGTLYGAVFAEGARRPTDSQLDALALPGLTALVVFRPLVIGGWSAAAVRAISAPPL